MKTTCTRRLQFCAGHRVVGHEGKCKHLHGHNYVAFITAEAPDLDSVGRVVDFSVLKEKVGTWIDKCWDHRMILWKDDPLVSVFLKNCPKNSFFLARRNPTAENMAAYLLEVCTDLFFDTEVSVTKIRLWETENCYAEVTA